MRIDKLGYYAIRLLAVEELKRRCRQHRAIVLSFDDGPGKGLSRSIAKLLDTYDAKATFFLLGRRIVQSSETVDLLKSAGHELGVHSYDHEHAWKLASKEAVDDINAGYEAAARWVPTNGLFRPPHGKLSYATWRALRKRGARICWWTVDSGDTWPTLPSTRRTTELILRAGGGVVLMHDFDREAERGAFVINTTETLLKTAKREGFKVMTVSDLFM
jgi:peptidoglycan-N-acetylglucosamine deacetylase